MISSPRRRVAIRWEGLPSPGTPAIPLLAAPIVGRVKTRPSRPRATPLALPGAVGPVPATLLRGVVVARPKMRPVRPRSAAPLLPTGGNAATTIPGRIVVAMARRRKASARPLRYALPAPVGQSVSGPVHTPRPDIAQVTMSATVPNPDNALWSLY